MCQDSGISPQHNRVLLIGNIALFFETGYLIFNIAIIAVIGQVSSVTNGNNNNRRLDGLFGMDIPMPIMYSRNAEQMSFEMEVVPHSFMETIEGHRRLDETPRCALYNCQTSGTTCAAVLKAKAPACDATVVNAQGTLNVDIATVVKGLVTACILGMVANLLIFIGLCALTCCCCSQNRTNPESCWWKYTAINCLLGVGIMLYPLIYFTDLTNQLGTFKDCLTQLVGCGSSIVSSQDALDGAHTAFVTMTVIYYLMMFLRLALGGLGCCLPKGAQAGGSMQNDYDRSNGAGGQVAYSGEMVAGTNKV